MRFPSKNTSYNDSILAKFPVVISMLGNGDKSVSELYTSVKDITEDIGEFVEILNCLYALGKLEFNEETRFIHYVG